MKRELVELLEDYQRDRTTARIARLVMGGVGVVAGLLILRSLPDLIRYVKMERM